MIAWTKARFFFLKKNKTKKNWNPNLPPPKLLSNKIFPFYITAYHMDSPTEKKTKAKSQRPSSPLSSHKHTPFGLQDIKTVCVKLSFIVTKSQVIACISDCLF